MRYKGKIGQGVLEYTLLLGAIIAVIVFVLLGQGGIKSRVQSSYEKVGEALNNTTSDLTSGIFKK
jgi:Flp pilus assembly pilin Flp